MCNGHEFPAWQAQCIESLLEVPGLTVELLIVNEETPGRTGKGVSRTVLETTLFRVYNRYVVRPRQSAFRTRDLSGQLAGVPILRCRMQRRGKFSEYASNQDVAEIRKYNLDIILRFSFGILRGEVLDAARYGIWSFHHDDEQKYRGAPPAFWEIYHQDPVTGAVLQRLTDRLDGGIVLHKGFFSTINHSYISNIDQVLIGSADWPARVCRQILNGDTGFLTAEPSTTKATIYKRPTNWQMIWFLTKIVGRKLCRIGRAVCVTQQWSVGIVESPISSFLSPDSPAEVRWLTPPDHGFIADPFAVPVGDDLFVVMENYDYWKRKGWISSATIRKGRTGDLQTSLDLPLHMSYPYLVTVGADLYCIPETWHAEEVALYRADPFPNTWSRVASLMNGVKAIDPTLFQWGGYWWLFFTDQSKGGNTKLYGYYSTEIFGPWEPHALNPLKTDIRSSRPAGTPFIHEGHLYRPAQDCSVSYGGRTVINRVNELSPTRFHEETVVTVNPMKQSDYPDGLHTISAAGPWTVIDGRRDLPLLPSLRVKLGIVWATIRWKWHADR
jgi:hypothetical protein